MHASSADTPAGSTENLPSERQALLAGLLYLVLIAAGIFAEFVVRGGAVVADDAAATAANILDSELLFRLGLAADLVVVSCDVALALLFFALLKPVSESISLLAALFRLTQAAVLAVITLTHLGALVVIDDFGYLRDAFEPDQLDAAALALLDVHAFGYDVALVFFGLSLLCLGYLVARSTYFPRWLGVLVVVAGGAYLIDSVTSLMAPSLDEEVAYVLVPAVIAEVSLALWLLLKGGRATGHGGARAEAGDS